LLTLLDGLRVLMPAMVKNNPCPGVWDTRASAAACAVHGRMTRDWPKTWLTTGIAANRWRCTN